jgi:hypothetical protein
MFVKVIERPKETPFDIVKIYECDKAVFPIYLEDLVEKKTERYLCLFKDKDEFANFPVDERSSVYVLNNDGKTIERFQ